LIDNELRQKDIKLYVMILIKYLLATMSCLIKQKNKNSL
jgi:hypothetical protein